MKYLKLYEDIDFSQEEVWEEDDYDDTIKAGDKVIITNDLYKKYPYWSDDFMDVIKNRTPLLVTGFDTHHENDTGKIRFVHFDHRRHMGYYVPFDMVEKVS